MHCQGNSWCVSGVNDVHKEMGCRKLVRQSRSSMVLKEVSATSHFNISWSFNFSRIEIPTPLLSCWIILDGSNHLIVPQCHLSSFCHLNDLTTYNETRLGEMCLELELKKKKNAQLIWWALPTVQEYLRINFRVPHGMNVIHYFKLEPKTSILFFLLFGINARQVSLMLSKVTSASICN